MLKQQLKTLFLVVITLFISSCSQKVKTKKVFLIGDSTCSDYGASRYPRTGWGSKFKSLIEDAEVINHALSGRSSKSFYEEIRAWRKTFSEIEEKDFVLIQFGHNDQRKDSLRYTSPYTSFQSYLLKYIHGIRSKKAYPILVTPISLNFWKNDSVLFNSVRDYSQSMKELAKKEKITLIDLNYLTKQKFETLGKNFTTDSIFMNLKVGEYKNYPEGINDNTHLQERGADLIAHMLLTELEGLKESDSIIKSLFE